MIIKPMVRNNLCLNSHPVGIKLEVERQIKYVKENLKPDSEASKPALPKLALILGCSNGYGLASRIAAAFGYGAVTVGVSWEKAATEKHTGTPGYYNNTYFERFASETGLVSKTVDGDAFSDEIKAETVKAVRQAAAEAKIPAKIDLVIYSLASPVRTDPKTGVQHKSVIKPTEQPFYGTSINLMDGKLSTVNVEPATEDEVANTVKVMGGEDWELWMDLLSKEDLLSPGTRTVAYSYIGPEHSWPVYKNGTIGKAKEDMERAAMEIRKKLPAWVSVNKALVTRSSAVIPVVQLYICCLFKVMKEMGLHEGCIEQITRLYKDRLFTGGEVLVDSEGRIRIDDWEMREDVQKATGEKMKSVTAENVSAITDIKGVKHDFLAVHGFDIAGVDYEADISPVI